MNPILLIDATCYQLIVDGQATAILLHGDFTTDFEVDDEITLECDGDSSRTMNVKYVSSQSLRIDQFTHRVCFPLGFSSRQDAIANFTAFQTGLGETVTDETVTTFLHFVPA